MPVTVFFPQGLFSNQSDIDRRPHKHRTGRKSEASFERQSKVDFKKRDQTLGVCVCVLVRVRLLNLNIYRFPQVHSFLGR